MIIQFNVSFHKLNMNDTFF